MMTREELDSIRRRIWTCTKDLEIVVDLLHAMTGTDPVCSPETIFASDIRFDLGRIAQDLDARLDATPETPEDTADEQR